MIWIIIIPVVIFFIIPFLAGFTGNYGIMKLYGVTYKDQIEQETEQEETSEQEELQELNKQERIEILDQTIIKYNHLLNSLDYQLKTEKDEKKKAALLAKQITVLEKYNKALERMEKLDQ